MGKTFASLFSGGGGADLGAIAAGLRPIWGVEIDPSIAHVYRQNVGAHIIVSDVGAVNYSGLESPDVLWASPSCKGASTANPGRKETEGDREAARAVARAIEALHPAAFALENVISYRDWDSYAIVTAALNREGYWWAASPENCADYGVPQTRRRLFIRARRDTMLRPLPQPVAWKNWYEAIEDLIENLPDSQFAPWQLLLLPNELQTVLVSGARPARSGTDGVCVLREAGSPALTVTASSIGRMRAWLVPGGNPSNSIISRPATAPAWTVVASARFVCRALLQDGRVVKMTPRALARFQSFPDSYILPDNRVLAGAVLGNAVPPLMAEQIIRSIE